MDQYFCYENLLSLFAAVAIRAERDAKRGSAEAKVFLQELRITEPTTSLVRKAQRRATLRWQFNESPDALRMKRSRADSKRR